MTFLDVLLPPLGGAAGGDVVAAPCWLLVNLLLGFTAWAEARSLFPEDDLLETVGHAIALGMACVVAVATTLGVAGCLSGPTLLLGVAAICLAALSWRRFRRPPPVPQPLLRGRGLLAALLWGSVLAFWAGRVVIGGLLKFPSDWDSLTYHIPLVDHWLQARSLYAPDCGRWSYPGNNELLALWAVAPFSGDFLVALNNLPATVLLACATVGLSRRLGLSAPLAHLSGLAAVCHHVALTQLVDAENDVAVAAAFFAALLYAFRHAERPARADVLLGAICLGLLAGMKYYALGYAALALAVWAIWAAARGPSASLRVLLAGGTGCLLLGSYWCFRNFAVTGSPLYPKELFTHPDLMTRIYPDVAHTSFLGNNRPELLWLYVQAIWKMTGPCQLAGFLLAPLSLAWLMASGGLRLYRRGASGAGVRLALAALLAGTGLLLAITPFAVEDDPGTLNQMHWQYCPVRYGLCFLNTAMLAAVFLVGDAQAWLLRFGKGEPGAKTSLWRRLWWKCPYLLLLVLAVAVLFQVVRSDTRQGPEKLDGLLLSGNLVLAGLLLVLLVREWPGARRWLLVGLLAATFPAWTWACSRLAQNWHQGFAAHYDRVLGGRGFTYLAREEPAGTVCVLDHRCYPFFGSRRQFRVCQPVYVASPEGLMELLDERRVSIIAARPRQPASGWHNFQGFEECLAQHPGRFRRVAESSGVILYLVVEPPKSASPPGGARSR